LANFVEEKLLCPPWLHILFEILLWKQFEAKQMVETFLLLLSRSTDKMSSHIIHEK
jgi:hypothetical protein